MLHTQFQASKPRGSEDFFNNFLCISMARTCLLAKGHLGPLDLHFLHTKFQTSGPSGSEEEAF